MCAKKILIVDDEPQILNLLEDALCKENYSVYLASNANEAFEILKQESIPLIFLDLGLRSINGFELCKCIRKNNPEAFIYALTGYAGFYDPDLFIGAGFDDYFGKPFILKDLYRIVKESFEALGWKGFGHESLYHKKCSLQASSKMCCYLGTTTFLSITRQTYERRYSNGNKHWGGGFSQSAQK